MVATLFALKIKPISGKDKISQMQITKAIQEHENAGMLNISAVHQVSALRRIKIQLPPHLKLT
jgi:hypothetical protein